MNSDINSLSARFEVWLCKEALPKWLSVGINGENGGHYESLTMSGLVDYHSDIRVRVQGRQAFCFALATKNGWASAESEARGILTFAERFASHLPLGGGFYHRLSSDFTPLDTREDLYDQAFFLLAYAACIQAFGDDGFGNKARQLCGFLDSRMAATSGGWQERVGGYGYRRQNPHMHLFEAFMSLYEATNDDFWMTRANAIYDLFNRYFYSPDHKVVFEFFCGDWSLLHPVSKAPVEPGHMMEWVWLLDWYSRLTGTSVQHLVQPLFRRGLAIGLSKNGLIYDEVNCKGTVHQSTMRSWGLTELIKAALVMSRRGESGAMEVAGSALDRLFECYLQAPFPGGYVDQVDESGNTLSDLCPASTLYHYSVLALDLREKGRYAHDSQQLLLGS